MVTGNGNNNYLFTLNFGLVYYEKTQSVYNYVTYFETVLNLEFIFPIGQNTYQ